QPPLPELVEKFRCRRLLAQPFFIERPDACEGFIAINELAASIENRDPGRDLVKRAAMGGHLPLQLVFGDGKGGHVEGSAAAAAIKWRGDGLINLDAAIDNGLKLRAPWLFGLAQAEQLRPLACLEKLDLLLQRLLFGSCANRRRIGRVNPAERAFG